MDSQNDAQSLVSVIIPTHDGARNVERLVRMAKQVAPVTEVILVCAGLRRHAADADSGYMWGAKVVAASKQASASECRAIGAQHAAGDVLLFLDGGVNYPVDALKTYIAPLLQGYDLVLSAGGRLLTKGRLSQERCAYALLNHLLGRKQLGCASLEKAPFALNRKALEAIGQHHLHVPAIALVHAVQKGLVIAEVPFGWTTARKSSAANQPLAKKTTMIFQEHAKAIQLLLQNNNVRGALPDGERQRILVQAPGLLHLRSVFFQESREKEEDGWGAKRKERAKRIRKRAQSRKKRSH
ncbi:glycosyltransferase family 2 protein [Brevibacillus sp. SAFN-007a]|uniref:glycosyltransferase family 2 protein n=1 Tax=Brevibacillus sp. SAFN-007a TaxID=3436862 RepID=UPI003F7D5599